MIAGLAVLGGGYLSSALSYAASSAVFGADSALTPKLLIPIAGPWLSLSDLNGVSDTERETDTAVLVMQGLIQATGLVLSTIGIAKYSSSATPARAASTGLRLSVGSARGGAVAFLQGAF